jgi:O-antigen/teichoic acid export membrane protein
MQENKLLNAYFYQLSWQLPNLVLIPILVLFLDSSNIVLLAKINTIIAVVFMISDWGHSTIGAQQISKYRHSKVKVIKIFRNGELIRLLNFFVLFLISLILFLFLDSFSINEYSYLIIISIISGAISQVIFPNWLIIGFSLYSKINSLLFFTRIFSMGFLVVISYNYPMYEKNFLILLICYNILTVIIFCFMRIYILRSLKIKTFKNFSRSFNRLKFNSYKYGCLFSLGNLFSYLTLSSGVFVADYYFGKVLAASYAAAERILVIARSCYYPLVQYMIVRLASKSDENMANSCISHISVFNFLAFSLSSILMYFIGEFYFYYFLNDNIALNCFRILAVGFFFLGLSHHYITFNMLGFFHFKRWFLSLFFTLIFYLYAVFSLALFYKNIYIVPVAIVFSEFFLFIYGLVSFFIFKRSNNNG